MHLLPFDINENKNPFHLNGIEEISWFVSIIALGEILGGICAGPMLDKYGRKTVIIINTIPFVIGWLIIAASSSISCVYIGRFITGFGASVVDVAVPVSTLTDLNGNMHYFGIGIFGQIPKIEPTFSESC